jgi:hypothetical protein
MRMNNRLIFVLVIIIALVITGCSAAPAITSSAPPVQSATTTALPTAAASQTTGSINTSALQTATAASPAGLTEWSTDGVIKPGEYTGSNKYGDYAIYWRSDEQFIYIGMTARTSGWVAVALQPGSTMKDADIMLGWVKDGKAEIRDLFCTDNLGTHPADTELGGTNNILVSGGKEEGGSTTLEFKRALTTGDKYDISIKAGVNKIMWSYGSSDNSDLKHRDRGYGEITP